MPLLNHLLKEILCYPLCKSDLEEDEPQAKLRCAGCGLAFPVRDGIPVMLIDEADKPEGFEPESFNRTTKQTKQAARETDDNRDAA